MKIKLENKNNAELTVTAGKHKLSINIGDDAVENNTNWNIESINNFLIKIASLLAVDEKLEIETVGEESNTVFMHITDLFKEFINEYNI